MYDIFLSAVFNECMLDEPGAICLNMKRYSVIRGIVFATKQSIKFFSFIFKGFCLNYK